MREARCVMRMVLVVSAALMLPRAGAAQLQEVRQTIFGMD